MEDNKIKDVLSPYYSNISTVYWYNNIKKAYYPFKVIKQSENNYITIGLYDYIYKANGYYVKVYSNTTFDIH